MFPWPRYAASASRNPNMPALTTAEPGAHPIRMHFSVREPQGHSVFPAQVDQNLGDTPGGLRVAAEHLVDGDLIP